MALTRTDHLSGSKRTGRINVEAKINFVKKVAMVDSRTCLWEFFLSDSWEIWIPNASEKESAIAIVKIPAITIDFVSLPAANPTSNHNVVITPDVIPKFIPIFNEVFIPKKASEYKLFLIDNYFF